MTTKTSFIKFMRIWGIVLLVGVGSSIIALDVIVSYRNFHVQAEQMRTDYIIEQKEMIKQEVDRVVTMIYHEKEQSEVITKEKVKSRVYEAYAIAQNIYQQFENSKNRAEIKQMILAALRPIRFAQGYGYYFATRLDGVEILFADKPELEGVNLLGLQDTHGQYVIKDMIEIVEQTDEGFYEYYWTKPGAEGNNFKKISFIKHFEPFNWFLGTGLYVDDVEASIKEKLMGQINEIRFGANGYFFVDTYQGLLLAHGSQPNYIGTNVLEMEDSKGNKVIQMLIATAKEGAGYVNYWWQKPTTGKESPKIAYVKGIPDWEILVGTGVYFDDVEDEIAAIQIRLNQQTKMKMIVFALIVIGVIIFVLFFFNRLNRRLNKDFNLLSSFFNRAARFDEAINRDLVQFIEFDQMADDANQMLLDKTLAQQNLLDEKDALRESEAKFRLMMEAMTDPVYICSDNYRVEYMNPAMIKRTGRDATGELCYMALHDFDKPCPWCKTKEEKHGKQLESEIVSPKDNHFYMVSRSPIINSDGSTSELTIFRDTTELMEVRDQLQQVQKMEAIGTLAGGVAHDFNNILTVIRGHAQLAMMQTTAENLLWNDLLEIEAAGDRASKLTRQLLAFSRKEAIIVRRR